MNICECEKKNLEKMEDKGEDGEYEYMRFQTCTNRFYMQNDNKLLQSKKKISN